ncbi:non-ribosomal peptide synthetase [Rhodococcus opacus]|uniref:non-ribosomal peptide synthetase n=1 Tax=Rhodococcus opacus TaxID=37919 RepID=UPI0005C25E75|nr:non-ribosomal peptide synthetase [Rhodococcus opacus]
MNPFPLSRAQQALWFAQQLDPDVPLNIAQYVEVRGILDLDALVAATERACRELESPVIRLVDAPGEPWQLVDQSISDALTYIDLRESDDPIGDAHRWMIEAYSRPLDVLSDRMIAATLLHLGVDHYYWYSHVHHLVMDGHGAMVLMNRVAEVYTHLVNGTEPPPPSALSLRELYEAEASYRTSSRFTRDQDHWKERMAELPDPRRLTERTARPVSQARLVTRLMDSAIATRVGELAKQWTSSEVPVIVAAFAAYMGRMTDSTDVVLTLPVSGRTTAAVRRSAGMVSNVVPLRVQVDPDVDARELVRRVQLELTGALRHQRFRYEDMRSGGGDSARRSFGPTVNIMNFHNEIVLGDLVGEFAVLTTGPVDDLSLNLYPSVAGRTVRIDFEGNPGLYSAEVLSDHYSRFLEFLDNFVGPGCDGPIGDLPILNTDELTEYVPCVGPSAPAPVTLASLLRSSDPSAPAVKYAGAEITYGELDARSNRLARRLIDHGIGPEDVVAALLPRSVESVVALWAVARAGAVYMPVDPGYPADRIAFMLADSGAAAALALDADGVPQGVSWIDIDDLPGSSNPVSDTDRVHPLSLDHPAYLLYTSGSTGAPKGVVVTHRGLAALSRARDDVYRVDTAARVAHFASPSFDISIEELLLAFTAGASVVIVPPEVLAGDELTELLRRERVTHAIFTPSVVASITPAGLPDLVVLDVGGEALPPELVARWAAGRTMVNSYGPTEATVTTLLSGSLGADSTVSIGRPVAGTSALVLDSRLRPVPIGVVGELYLAGPALARGYVGAPGLTAERFVANVCGSGRMYRTGDLVRWSVTRELEFVGRVDDQVKLRGFRVELGEIDAVLMSFGGVDAAVTVVRGNVLTSYVVGPRLHGELLREFASKRLPRYMVPASVTVLGELPLTRSGKVDRGALPEPVLPSVRSPRGPLEELVAGVIADVLGVGEVDAETDFFTLGGNSLSATRVVSALSAASGVRLGVRELFEQPTVAGLASILAKGGERRPPLEHRPGRGPVPLAPAQQPLWVLDRVQPESSAYAEPFVVDLDGYLDVDALRLALTDVVGRHSVLRTVFPETDHGPVQDVTATTVDLVSLNPHEISDFTARGFDLTAEPPIRVGLCTHEPDRHTLAIVVHHIAVDGLSIAPLVRDVTSAYEARSNGRSPDWAPLPVDYADYSRWQRELMGDPADRGSLASRQLHYWTTTLADAPTLLGLPTDRPRLFGDESSAGQVRFTVPAELHQKMETLAREKNSTTFMVLHAALVVLLHKLTGTDDIVVGTPTSGRTDPALDEVVGMFVGIVPLRSRVNPRVVFTELLASVQSTDLAAFANSDVPFDMIVDAVTPARSGGHHPLFQVMFAFQDFADVAVELPGIRSQAREVGTRVSRFDLEVSVRERRSQGGGPGGLTGTMAFPEALFDQESVTQWAERLLRVLTALTDESDMPVGAIDVLSAEERAFALSKAEGEALETDSLADLLDVQVAQRPHAVAATFGSANLTYAELHRRAEELACRLRDVGVATEDVVAVALSRSIDLVIAIVAVAKAGGVYMPVDVDYPAERIRYLLSDASPAALLTSEADAERLPAVGVPTLMVSSSVSADHARTVGKYARGRGAYLIYTSGSTGQPKGVLVSHANVLSLLANTCAEFGFGPGDVWTLFHSFSFDFSVWEMWGALTTGGRLVLVDHFVARSPDEFTSLLEREGVTVLNQTPSAFAQLVDRELPLSLRLLIFGGEPLGAATVAPLLERRPDIRAVNMFGITETTVHVTRHDVTGVETRPSVGVPLPGVRAYVLDASLQPVPPGTVGELYVAGTQVSRGYHQRPALTAARFVASVDGGRMYRTGDRVRQYPDGTIDYIGRADSQVEIRGYRIEPGEIEAALLRHPSVDAAAVVLRDAALGNQLVAYPVTACDAAILYRHLRAVLPEHLVPGAIVPVTALPLTVNGKLDVKALPEPGVAAADGQGTHTPIEDVVADVFTEVLGAAEMGTRHNFFDLGGNSLLATRVSARVSAVFDIDVTVKDVFEAPTVAELASRIEERSGGERRRPPLRPASSVGRIPLSPAQQRMWFVNQFDTGASGYNLPLVVRLDGELDVHALASAASDLIERHHTLRTVYPSDAEGVHQVVLDAGDVPLDLTPIALPEDAVDAHLRAFVDSGFDVSVDAPIRSRLYRVGPESHVLALVVHHIAADAWSLTPLIRDTMTAYQARLDGGGPEWPPLPVQYSDYSVWQRAVLDDASADALQQYWLDTLADLPERVTLPTDHPRPAAVSGRAGTVGIELDEQLHDALNTLARNGRATTFMVLHAALAAVLSRYSGSRDVPIGTAVAGRTDPQLDDMVGMFAGTLVLRTAVDPSATFMELLAHVHERDIAAYTHADMPFETLVELLNPARSTSHHLLFQVALSMQRSRIGQVTLPGLTVTPVGDVVDRANFDLQLTVTESGPGGRMHLDFGYDADLYEHATIEQFASRLVRFLSAVGADPQLPVGDIDLFDAAERAALVPAVGPAAPAPSTLREILTRGVAVAPDAVAVIGGGVELSYRELDARSDVMARELVENGAGPGILIPWAEPRSVDSVVRLWAIAKTGAAPVLFDPARTPFPPREWESVPGHALPLTGEVAYVVYTSGTTGTPKGVVVTHDGLAALDADLRERYAAGPGCRMLHRGAAGFDMTLLEVLVAGASGATLVIASDAEYAGPPLADLMERDRITHACMTPTILATLGERDLPDLQVLMVGGERLGSELVNRWAAGRRVYNAYGPAEATMYAVATGPLAVGEPVSIGAPVRGVSALVLDDRLRPVPPGVPGELYLAGGALARGYADQPGLTAERFVAAEDGARVYRTGDLVRWRVTAAGHELEYLGRNDSQIKMRGVRVEPAEIDTVIARLADVVFAGTVVRTTGAGTEMLVSYVLPTGHLDVHDLRRRLAESLPAYLVPTAVVMLDAAPPTVNGKLDLRSLPMPELSVAEDEPPHTDTERAVASVFADVLGHEIVGRGTHFFDAGGNSLLATQLTARLTDSVGHVVPLRTLFAHPTVAELAEALDDAVPETDLRPVLVARPRPDRIPLSRSQYRMWVLNRTDPGSPTYNLPATVRMDGALDVDALTAAFEDVIRRHETLRTRYPVDGQPYQEILEPAPLDLHPVDVRDPDEFMEQFASRGFDLTRDRPIRVALLRLHPQSHVLAVNIHHIAADGWSLTPLVSDVLSAYAAHCSGIAPHQDPLPLQYADYAVWERELLDGDYGQRRVEHWRRALDGVDSTAPLPTDRPTSTTARAGVVAFDVSADVQQAVHQLAAQHHATPFMVLHAALSVVLSRHGAQPDVVVATAVAGRGERALDSLVGMFVNTLALRAQVLPDMPFTGLLAQVRDFDVDAFEHADVPFEVVAGLLGGRTPQVALALHNLQIPTVEAAGMTVTAAEFDTGTAKFDLHLTLTETSDDGAPTGMRGAAVYADLFDEASVRALVSNLVRVLQAVGADPDLPVDDLALPGAEPLVGAEPADERTLAEILTATAAAFPDHAALTDGDVTLTYRELDERSDARARELTALGIAPGDVVPIDLPRSPDFVVELWAVAKTGAAFSPVSGFGSQSNQKCARDVAYVIHTSGSTGTPKAVAVTHRGLGPLTAEVVRRYRVGPGDRVLHGYNPAFDAALLEMLLAFGSGACLVVAPADVFAGAELHRLLVDQQVTHYLSTPSVLATLDPRGLEPVRVVGVGGEALSPELAATWCAGRLLLNAYGPTESTVVATLTEIDPASAGGAVTIGAPIPGTTALVLDTRLRAVPVGGVGELYLAGPGLAQGYLDAPDRTAERFVAAPGGSRMYRTGDLVHRRADGTLSFAGRVDRQIKLRGMRIEPAQVEAALLELRGVEQAAVSVQRHDLVAFVAGTDLDSRTLREELTGRLPSYLVPPRIVTMDALPLTANGKLDVAALDDWDDDVIAAPPRTAVEEMVAGIFADVLGSTRIGAGHNFFDAGGDSLSATAVTARLSATFGVDVPVRVLFENPSPASLAGWLGSRASGVPRPALTPRPRGARVPLSPAQQRMWLLSRANPDTALHNMVFVTRIGSDVDVDALRLALRDVLQRHAVLRTVFPVDAEGPHQLVLPVEAVTEDVSAEAGFSVDAWSTRPFDLTTETPVRVMLRHNGTGDYTLGVVVHHIALDGGSMGPLLADLGTAYQCRLDGSAPQWAPLSVDYADYAIWMHELLGAGSDPASAARAQLDHWAQVLAGVGAPLPLPTDRPRPELSSHIGSSVEWTLDDDVRERLGSLARTRGTTVFMVLHAALAVLLARLSGHSDVVVGTAVGGRPDPALDAVVGMFAGTVALRTPVSPAQSFEDFLADVRTVDLDALAHADIPFDEVVAHLAPERSPAYNPLFQVMLTYQRAVEFPQLFLGTDECRTDTQATEFDLAWDVTDAADALTVRLDYATDLFDRQTAQTLLRRFAAVLDAALTHPAAAVGDLEILGDAERAHLVQGPRTGSTPRTLRDILETRARATPSAVAVIDGDTEWSYRALDELSDRWARALASRGVGPEDVVAVATPRGRHWLLAVWSVTKAGAAWMSLDPAHPAERLDWMLTDSGAIIGLTAGGVTDLPRSFDWMSLDEQPTGDADPAAPDVDNAAYVIYTSGSTGRPKGVVVTHRGLTALLATPAYDSGTDYSGSARVLQLTSPTFDVSVFEMLWAVSLGGALVAAPAFGFAGDELARFLTSQRITHLTLTPTVLASLDPGRIPPSTVVVGGEALPADLADRWSRRHRLFNAYGPTEFTVDASVAGPLEPGRPITIGHALDGNAAFVLDARLHPVPDGVTGELYLAGSGIARGYGGRSDLTAGQFVAHPYGKPGERLYRTGDLVRRDPNGALDYLGRSDSQVKIRGIRVEPAEVDAVLLRHPGVEFAVTIAVPTQTDTVLASYVGGAGDLSARALADFTRGRLPRHLVPAPVTVVDALPLLPSGKLDRAALPAPAIEIVESALPAGELEGAIAAVFAEVLGVADVPADEAFFTLGGTSMGAASVATELRRRLDRDVPIEWIFTDPTVQRLAARIDDGARLDSFFDTLVELRPGGAGAPLFCVHPLSGLAWCFSGLADHVGDRPLYGIQATGVPDLPGTLSALAARYVDAIRVVQPDGPYHLLGWSLGGTVAHEMAVQLRESGHEVAAPALLDTLLPQHLPPEPETLTEDELIAQFGSYVSADRLREIRALIERLELIASTHSPRRFDGNLDLFVAARDLDRHPDVVDAWREHAGGVVTAHHIDTTHSEMADPGPLAEIGRLLRRSGDHGGP